MSDQRILFITQEIAPYLPESTNSILGRMLPQKMQSGGFEVRTFMPKFGAINERRNQLHEVIRLSGLNIPINDADHPLIIKVASLQTARIQVYFIDNEDYFQKSADDIDAVGSNRSDNDERAIFFARGTMETVKKLRWDPKIIHCSGWITALTPMYLRRMYSDDPSLSGAKIVYSVLPGKVAGIDKTIIAKLAADGATADDLQGYADGLFDTDMLHRLAIDFADAVVMADPEASPELTDYITAKNVPVLLFADHEKGHEAYSEFYKKLIDNED